MPDRVNRSGYAAKVDVLLASQITALDQAQNESLDGLNGGTYLPAAVVVIDGAGIGGTIETSSLSGELSRDASGHVKRLLDTTTLTDTATAQPIEPTADKFEVPFGHTNNLIVELDKAGTVVPVAGDCIEVYRRGAPSKTVAIKNGVAGATLVTMGGAFVGQFSGCFFAKCVFDGSNWVVWHCSMDTG